MLNNLEAEQGLLGCLLYDKGSYDKVCDVITRDMFSNATHQRIYEAIDKLAKVGKHATPTLLKKEFENDVDLRPVGGWKYLVDLSESVISLSNVPDYADHIKDLYLKRQVQNAIANVEDDFRSGRDLNEAIERLERDIYAIRENDSMEFEAVNDTWSGALDWIEGVKTGRINPLKTGYGCLDRIIQGFLPGRLYVMAARPGMGKTALSLNIAENAASQGDVLFFSLEMPKNELCMRLAARKTGINVSKQSRGHINDNDLSRLVGSKMPTSLYVLENGKNISEIVTVSRRFARAKDAKLIVIDYLGLIEGDKRMQKVHQIEEITTRLKSLSKQLNVPILLLSQLSRGVEMRDCKKPVLADLRDSGAIEQDADVVMFIYREAYYLSKEEPYRGKKDSDEKYAEKVERWQQRLENIKDNAEIIVSKNRQGQSDTALMSFDGERQFFYERGF